VPFTSLARGAHSRITQPQEAVIQSAGEWQDLWSRHAPATSPPPVDFTTEMVIGIFAGERRTAGHDLQIVAIERTAIDVVVMYQVRAPRSDAVVAQVLTSPFHLVRLPRQGLPFRFEQR
jgi:hypothetical protein